jgi:sugar phosphate isomerase/epimerase
MSRYTRRRFLAGTGGCGLAALVAAALPPSSRATPLGGPVGIQLYAVKDALQANPPETLRAIRQIGFGEVETAGFGKLSVQQFRAILDEVGLRCPSAHLQLDAGDPGPAFEQAHALGAHYAASGSLRAALFQGQPPPGMSLDEAQRTAELANRLGELARRAGLQYAYHNHDFEFAPQADGTIGYDVLLRETDPGLVEFEIDCGWMVVGGRDPRDYFRRFPHRFPMIHVKDFLPAAARSGGGSALPAHPGAELGHGMIDYQPIFAVAEKAGLKHYFAEQEGPFTRMSQLDAARQAYAYLRSLS